MPFINDNYFPPQNWYEALTDIPVCLVKLSQHLLLEAPSAAKKLQQAFVKTPFVKKIVYLSLLFQPVPVLSTGASCSFDGTCKDTPLSALEESQSTFNVLSRISYSRIPEFSEKDVLYFECASDKTIRPTFYQDEKTHSHSLEPQYQRSDLIHKTQLMRQKIADLSEKWLPLIYKFIPSHILKKLKNPVLDYLSFSEGRFVLKLRGISSEGKETVLEENEPEILKMGVLSVFRAAYDFVRQHQYGNCGELSWASAYLLLKKRFFQGTKSTSIEIVRYAGGYDHAFLVLDRDPKSRLKEINTWGEKAAILDPYRSPTSHTESVVTVSEALSRPAFRKFFECEGFVTVESLPVHPLLEGSENYKKALSHLFRAKSI